MGGSKLHEFLGKLLIVGILMLGAFGLYQSYQTWRFLSAVLYTDPQGNTISRGKVLEIVGDSALQQILQNATKAQAAQNPAPPPASPVK